MSAINPPKGSPGLPFRTRLKRDPPSTPPAKEQRRLQEFTFDDGIVGQSFVIGGYIRVMVVTMVRITPQNGNAFAKGVLVDKKGNMLNVSANNAAMTLVGKEGQVYRLYTDDNHRLRLIHEAWLKHSVRLDNYQLTLYKSLAEDHEPFVFNDDVATVAPFGDAIQRPLAARVNLLLHVDVVGSRAQGPDLEWYHLVVTSSADGHSDIPIRCAGVWSAGLSSVLLPGALLLLIGATRHQFEDKYGQPEEYFLADNATVMLANPPHGANMWARLQPAPAPAQAAPAVAAAPASSTASSAPTTYAKVAKGK